MAEGKDGQGFQLWWIAAPLAVVAAIVVGILLADGGDDDVDTVGDDDATPADTVDPDEPIGDEPGEDDGATEPPTMDTLANMTNQSEYTKSGEAPLEEGEYREPATEDIVDNQILVGLVEADASEESLRIYDLQGDELVPA